MASRRRSIEVAYIIGSGRSGSTLLSCILGSHGRVEGSGELWCLSSNAWRDGEYCSCGRPADGCPFWTAVRSRWVESIGCDDVERYIALQRTFERNRSLPRLVREMALPSEAFGTYGRWTYDLYASISAVSGKRIVLDASKAPSRALALSLVPGLELKLIHLVRDVRGVTHSRQKAFEADLADGVIAEIKPMPAWRSALIWVGHNLAAEVVKRAVGPAASMRLAYETLTAEPQAALAGVGRLLGIDLTDVAEHVAAGGAVGAGHNVGGNRMRMTGEIRLRRDLLQSSPLPPRDERVVRALAGVMMEHYARTT